MPTIGERIKDLRKGKSETQAALSAALGVTQGFLSGVEKNKYKATTELLISIANKYSVDINWLLTGERKIEKEFKHLEHYVPGVSESATRYLSAAEFDTSKPLEMDELHMLTLMRALKERPDLHARAYREIMLAHTMMLQEVGKKDE